MAMRFSQRRTAGGHPLDVAASALQKEIRRGNEEEALYWAQEIEGGGYANYLWKRLVLISYEDIGIANPLASVYVETARQHYWEFLNKHKKHSGLFLCAAVSYLARSLKTRRADHLVSITYLTDTRLEPPDYVYDEHTQQGRRLGRGVDHFYEEGAVISPFDPELENLRERAWAIDKDKKPRPWLVQLREKLKQGKAAPAEPDFPSDHEQGSLL